MIDTGLHFQWKPHKHGAIAIFKGWRFVVDEFRQGVDETTRFDWRCYRENAYFETRQRPLGTTYWLSLEDAQRSAEFWAARHFGTW